MLRPAGSNDLSDLEARLAASDRVEFFQAQEEDVIPAGKSTPSHKPLTKLKEYEAHRRPIANGHALQVLASQASTLGSSEIEVEECAFDRVSQALLALPCKLGSLPRTPTVMLKRVGLAKAAQVCAYHIQDVVRGFRPASVKQFELTASVVAVRGDELIPACEKGLAAWGIGDSTPG